jgi:hypothetical protein
LLKFHRTTREDVRGDFQRYERQHARGSLLLINRPVGAPASIPGRPKLQLEFPSARLHVLPLLVATRQHISIYILFDSPITPTPMNVYSREGLSLSIASFLFAGSDRSLGTALVLPDWLPGLK